MADENEPDDIVPVVICEADGRPVDMARQNRKAFEKSIEQGHLWVVTAHDRVLPYTDARPVSLKARGSWNLARLAAVDAAGAERGVTERADELDGGAGVRTPSGGPHAASVGTTAAAGGEALGTVLSALAGVIRTRKRELPEGSYTTHLFQSGSEKIRKKLGEESVELILASERDRKISETADLLYHLLVLLADEEISLDEIARELEKR